MTHLEIPLATCSYGEYLPHMGAPVRTSLGFPKWFPHPVVLSWDNIMPSGYMLNLGSEQEYQQHYFRKLDQIGLETLRGDIDALLEGHAFTFQGELPPRLVLLCYEKLSKRGNWCHRNMFAEWWEARTGQHVQELGAPPHAAQTPPDTPPALF